MNIYWIDAGEQYEIDVIDSEIGGPRDYFDAIALIAAPSRGRAKSLFLQQFHGLEWTSPMSIRLIESNLDIEQGDVQDDTLWLQASLTVKGDDPVLEWATWQHLHEDGVC